MQPLLIVKPKRYSLKPLFYNCLSVLLFIPIISIGQVEQSECNTDLPSIQFPKSTIARVKTLTVPRGGTAANSLINLNTEAKTILNSASATIKNLPMCNIKVIGYGGTTKNSQQLSWDMTKTVVKYLIERRGISGKRIIFIYGQEGNEGRVDLEATSETGPSSVPAPHPNLSKL